MRCQVTVEVGEKVPVTSCILSRPSPPPPNQVPSPHQASLQPIVDIQEEFKIQNEPPSKKSKKEESPPKVTVEKFKIPSKSSEKENDVFWFVILYYFFCNIS